MSDAILPTMDNGNSDELSPSIKWLTMDLDKLHEAMNKFQSGNYTFKSFREINMFHYVLLNLLTKDEPKIHEDHKEPDPLKRGKKRCSPVVLCLKKLYEDIKMTDAKDHQTLLQSYWIRTVLKPKTDYWNNSLERLSYIELPFLEYAVVVLDQEIENSCMGDFYVKIGKDIIDVFKDKAKQPSFDETKFNAILALCKSLATSTITKDSQDSFTMEQIAALRKIFCENQMFKRPSLELVMEAKRKKLEQTQLENLKP